MKTSEIDVVSGSMITLKCDEETRILENRKDENIDWFVNSVHIKTGWFDWRISISASGRLGLWPIQHDESGNFECYVNGKLRGSVFVNVVSMKHALLMGLINYLYVSLIFGICTLFIGCIIGNRNQEIQVTQVDRIEEFLTEKLFKDDQMIKERIAKINEEKEMNNEGAENVERKEGANRSTIMQSEKPSASEFRKGEPSSKQETSSAGPRIDLPSTNKMSTSSNHESPPTPEANIIKNANSSDEKHPDEKEDKTNESKIQEHEDYNYDEEPEEEGVFKFDFNDDGDYVYDDKIPDDLLSDAELDNMFFDYEMFDDEDLYKGIDKDENTQTDDDAGETESDDDGDGYENWFNDKLMPQIGASKKPATVTATTIKPISSQTGKESTSETESEQSQSECDDGKIDAWDRVLMFISFPVVFSFVAIQDRAFS
ncbi:unnamed protein product [Caenorhabditis bovis]|uniref:Ig-like domain-containing protein n=1 Tax=Caenorhabditis bovis TaxID=2654633 RepID=A0A8S1FF01_9PELO|nr:unnamed protein product [Caenorhabditis bovis]